MLLTHPSVQRTGPVTENCVSPKVLSTKAEKPCPGVGHTLLHFSTFAGPQEVNVVIVGDARLVEGDGV